MTIDEAIKHEEEVADEKENEGKLLCESEGASIGCLNCAEYHRQLASWLKELKQLKGQKSTDNEELTVETEPVRHGKWIYGENTLGYDGYYCSECARHIRWHRGAEDIDFINNYYYCPECGAKMDAR